MNINNHRLIGEGIGFVESPSHSGLFEPGLPDTIIIHFTAGSSAESSVSTLCNPKTKASAHLVVGRDGSITQLVSFNTIAWHAGNSSYKGRVGFNRYSIGIEIDNAGRLTKAGNEYSAWFGRAYPEAEVFEGIHRNESKPSYWHRYPERQISAVYDLCDELVDTYRISQILGHEEISPGRKTDPGPAFPLDKLRERLLERDRAEEGKEELLTGRIGLVSASKLNIRLQPGTTSPTVAQPLTKGTKVEIVQEIDGWLQVNLQIQGWVKKEYIKT